MVDKKDAINEVIEEFKEKAKKSVEEFVRKTPIRFDKVLSTGSTLLDLLISGKRVRGGGIPGGIVVEVFGPPGSGKTAILAEVAASAQINGGDVQFNDPEGRLDKDYCEIYEMHINEKNYSRPNTVTEVFEGLYNWKPKNSDVINVSCNDSLAALSTQIEMESQDKMGMRRAKEFSEGFRKSCRILADNNWLMICSNQIRDGQNGQVVTPGGWATPFYSSLRIQIKPSWHGSKIEKIVKLDSGKEVKKIVGICSEATIVKSSLDDPFRKVPIYLRFGFGIDDIQANLQWIKDMTKGTTYDCTDGKTFRSMDQAINYIEQNNLESALRENVINMWEEIENKFDQNRKKKIRR